MVINPGMITQRPILNSYKLRHMRRRQMSTPFQVFMYSLI
jgi:hypothetical protein